MKKRDENGKKLHKSYVRWLSITGFMTAFVLVCFALIIILVDPVFHYHAPLKGLSYPLFNDRYQNDGIARHFTYDGIITGTSMTQNFKTSEADRLFEGTFVKLCFPGGHFKEINDNLKRAYTSDNEIKYIIRCLDETYFIEDKDTSHEEYDYPVYLTNDNPFDDVNYLWNKFMLSKVVDVFRMTKNKQPSTSFDEFGSWAGHATYGKEAVLKDCVYKEPSGEEKEFTKEKEQMVRDNIRQNVTDLVREHPETTFYFYFPPYSIAYWSDLKQNGELGQSLAAQRVVIEELLEYPNVHLFSFHTDTALTCNLDHYKDKTHYSDKISSEILKRIQRGDYEITKENRESYLDEIEEFYTSYDYASLYQ